MSDSTPREQANELINRLARENGWISEQDREFLSIHQPGILTSLNGARRLARSSTKALSDNLNQKNTRFVYELIQNAEDNSYETAKKERSPPSLSFTVSKRRIVIDSNEDGFCEANVSAICTVGGSTKATAQGYIGEKGIGFKSVFKIAKSVHIRSEPYSFAFDYDQDQPDSGLGMVTPVPAEYFALPPRVRTRMVLSLRTDCDTEQLFREFENLPDIFLLFLDRLKKLSLRIERPGEDPVEKVYTISTNGNRATITKAVGGVKHHFYFWVAKKKVQNMPKDPKRVIKKEGKPDEWITTAEVVLALPLDIKDVPIIEIQHVFAFLPMRKVGFKFLIQSDFITQDHQEDISDTPWNRKIFSEIIALFIELENELWNHPTLRYQWLRYLPVYPIPYDFWRELQQDLINTLLNYKILVNCREKRLEKKKAIIVPTHLRDDDGHALLPDCNCQPACNGTYVSEKYDRTLDIPVLENLGVQELAPEQFVHRLHVDLEKRNALMWSHQVDHRWHRRIADLLLGMVEAESSGTNLVDDIRLLPLIPLIGGRRVCAKGSSIYLPTCGGIDVPRDLLSGLVEPEALRNEARARLFRALGVKECTLRNLFGLIVGASGSLKSTTTLEQSVQHVRFLYWHHNDLDISVLKPTIYVFDVHSKRFDPDRHSEGWTYWPSKANEYHLYQHLDTKLEINARFLHPAYHHAIVLLPKRYDTSPTQWLTKFFNLHFTAQLFDRANFLILSPEIRWLMKNKPQFLLKTIQAASVPPNFLPSIRLNDAFSTCSVPIMDSTLKMPLCECYFPIPKLRETISQFGLERDFGFVSELRGETDWAKWKEFGQLGIKTEEDLSFWIRVLEKASAKSTMDVATMGTIYGNLQRMCTTGNDHSQVREAFSATGCNYIFIAEQSVSRRWYSLSDCLWSGPSWYNCRPLIANISEYSNMYHLFRTILGLKIAGLSHYLEDLASMKQSKHLSSGIDVASVATQLYGQLWKETNVDSSEATLAGIRDRFTSEKLVYDSRRKTWQSPANCIWARESIQIPGAFSIQDQYRSLEKFFTRVLEVEVPALELHVRGLEETASRAPTIDDIKQRIRNICQFSPKKSDLGGLIHCNCFPVSCTAGVLDWVSSTDDFAINDRKEYLKLFRDKIDILCFSLEEVHEFRPFLIGLGLEDRFLSKLVVPSTSVEGGETDIRLTADLRRKAYAICRFSAHYGSNLALNKTDETFQIIQNLRVFSTDAINRKLKVSQKERDVVVQAESAYCHFQGNEDERQIKIYVPNRSRDLEICLATHLPLAMLAYLGVDETKLGVFPSLVSANSLAVVDNILDTAGIINLAGAKRPEDDGDHQASKANDGEQPVLGSTVRGTSATSHRVERLLVPSTRRSHSRSRSADYFGRSPSSGSHSPHSSISTPATSIPDSVTPGRQRDLYKMLLLAVVDAARNMAGGLPCGGYKIASPYTPTLSLTDVELAASGSDRNSQIGAAGELFVFEWLQSLLPDTVLHTSNWQSRIRGRVKYHPSYKGLENWSDEETSDIVYDDTGGFFTHFLIKNGYLSSIHWNDKRPKYYIEVKSTTSTWTDRFYVTRNQFNLMEENLLPEGSPVDVDAIYLIARVYNLGHVGMGLKLYLDPANLNRKGELVFRARDEYEVVPGFVFGT